MHLYRSVAPKVVRDAYFASVTESTIPDLDNWRSQYASQLARARKAFKGGAAAVEMLIRRSGETPMEWASRQNHYRNVPIISEAVKKVAWLVYGKPPSREVWVGEKPQTITADILNGPAQDEITNQLSDFIDGTLDENRDQALMLKAARARILDGIAPCKFWGVDTTGTPSLPFEYIREDFHKAEDVKPIYDPDDPDILLAVIEYRPSGWIMHTTEEVVFVEPDLSIKGDAGAHPLPGVIPFAFFGDGCSLVGDLLDYQKVLINRHSTQWALERSTCYPVGVMHGVPQNPQVVPEMGAGLPGQPKSIDIAGGLRYLAFPDPQGGFTWVSADADSAGLRESYLMDLKEALELGAGLPADIGALDGGTPEQPTTVMLRWLRAFINRDALVLEAEAFEDARMHILTNFAAEYSRDFGISGFDPDAADWEIRFPDNPLPQDQRAQRQLELSEVSSDLRPAALYVKEHVAPEADADELKMIMTLLDQQKTSKFGEIPPPPDFTNGNPSG